jgi:hypothetical protein
MIRHNSISFFCSIFILVMILASGNTNCFLNPSNLAPDLPQADLDFMNSPEFSDMMEEFERELAALPPEERAAFDEMMNEFARVIQEMPEEEFNKLLEDINNDMQMSDEMGLFDATETVDVSVAPAIDISAPVIHVEIPNEIKVLAELLQTTKTYLALLLSKIQIAPDLPLKIDKWMRNKKITGISDEYTWTQFIEDTEKLIAVISIMLETDAKSNPIFLFEIHKDESLKSHINELSSILSGVPNLEISEFGIKQEKEINEQIQHIISEISQLMLQQGLIQKLQLLSQKPPKDAIKQETPPVKTEKPMIVEESSFNQDKFPAFDFDYDEDEYDEDDYE